MSQRKHNVTLDGLRGVAAAAVVWYHMTFQAFSTPTPSRGYLAVDFFFILSGLVVAGAYENRLAAGMTLLEFARIRMIRLYPLIVLGLAFGAGSKMLSAHHGDIPAAAAYGVLLLPYAWGAHDIFPLDPPLWSLMFEFWANLFYAIVIRLNPKAMKALLVPVIGLGAGGIITYAKVEHGLTGGHNMATLGAGAARVACAFFIGVALHRILTPERVARLPSVPFPVLAAAVLLAFFGSRRFGAFYDVVAVLVIFPAIVTLGMKDCATGLWRMVAAFGGRLSYPIYILHEATLAHFTHFRGHSLPLTAVALTAAFLALIAISYAVTVGFDEPARRWLSEATKPKPPPAPRV